MSVVERAKKAIDAVHGNTKISLAEVLDDLREVRDYVEELVECVADQVNEEE